MCQTPVTCSSHFRVTPRLLWRLSVNIAKTRVWKSAYLILSSVDIWGGVTSLLCLVPSWELDCNHCLLCCRAYQCQWDYLEESVSQGGSSHWRTQWTPCSRMYPGAATPPLGLPVVDQWERRTWYSSAWVYFCPATVSTWMKAWLCLFVGIKDGAQTGCNVGSSRWNMIASRIWSDLLQTHFHTFKCQRCLFVCPPKTHSARHHHSTQYCQGHSHPL